MLHVSASFPRSADDPTAPFLADLTRAQRDAGWEVGAVAVHDAGLPRRHDVGGAAVRRARYAPDRLEVLAYRGGGHRSLRSPAHALLLPGLLAGLGASVAAEVRSSRPAVVHAHWLLPAGLVVAGMPALLGRPRRVLTMHGNDVELAATRGVAPIARWVARRFDTLVAVSEPLARRAEGVLALPEGTVGVARLPLPTTATPVDPPARGRGPLRVLAAGRASAEKGFDVLLDAVERLPAGVCALTLVTGGPQRGRLEARIAASGVLGAAVTLLPLESQGALHARMAAHDAVAVPSRAEGLGMLALEALAIGRPVVASRVGGLEEVVADGVDGFLVAPGDSAALAAALADLARAPMRPLAGAVAHHRAAAVVDQHARAYGFTAPDRAREAEAPT